MDYVTLGRTGLNVSVISLGAGGSSRLGIQTERSGQHAAEIVQNAIERGINLIDTAEAYGTESVVGAGLKHVKREDVIISTKYSLRENKGLKKAEDFEKSVDQSLANLNTDYLDIYHLHGVDHTDYDYAVQQLVPEMIKMKEKGKIRFLGITEAFASDSTHKTLERAVQDNCWDVMMVGFNLLNQSAREKIFKAAVAKNIGVLDMFAVRRALSRPEVLIELLNELFEKGLLDARKVDRNNPLGFLVHPDGAHSIVDAAYRFCRYEPGVHSVLMGTGNLQHLANNIESVSRGPLPEQDIQRLKDIFAGIDSITGN
ncbi:aldo/keto reductase [Paenibacillus sepulcri]|uniref:Aldo/keto reductase n=1 Tax=Paenibacillus sepulcri TaxID=359917 RepID=A0ABS7BY29_9BACL|nr:aldo/keto reductase [Paenibacillus sepulcri]